MSASLVGSEMCIRDSFSQCYSFLLTALARVSRCSLRRPAALLLGVWIPRHSSGRWAGRSSAASGVRAGAESRAGSR
eukprot:423708-Alexandrium_andersonii.AAC.1